MKYYTNPHLFFMIKDRKIICWNYKDHEQYEISQAYFEEIQNPGECLEITDELVAGGLISEQPYEDYNWQWDDLSKIYHIGTINIQGEYDETPEDWARSYLEFSQEIIEIESAKETSDPAGKVVDLPDCNNDLLNQSLFTVLKTRQTTRQFSDESISLDQLSTLLFTGFGKFHGEGWVDLDEDVQIHGFRRTSPSGGGLHPVSGYVIVNSVDGLERGVYYYNHDKHKLIQLENPHPEPADLTQKLCGQYFSEGIAVGIILAADFDKVWTKYTHSRSYRDVYLDCGHVSQTLLLTATAMQLQTWETAWFKDRDLSDLIDLNGIQKAPLFFLGIGKGPITPLPKGI